MSIPARTPQLIPQSRRAPGHGTTWRALLAGSIIAFCISTGAPYGNMVLRGSYMALDFSTAGAIFLFFLFVLFVHTGHRPDPPQFRL